MATRRYTFTKRDAGALLLLLWGTTFLWFTSSFTVDKRSGTAWLLVQVLSVATVFLFFLSAWAFYKRRPWWEAATIAGSVVGLATLIPYAIAAHGTTNFGPNVGLHGAVNTIILIVLLVPSSEHWVRQHTMGGPREIP
jgi:hypothetical protein